MNNQRIAMGKKKSVLFVLTIPCITFVLVIYCALNDFNVPTTACSPNATPPCRGGGYVLVLRYSGQQGAGIKAVSSLQQWIRDLHLPMTIVEPFVQNSVLGVRPARHGRSKSIKFGEMFDLVNFNAVSRSEGLAEMIPWSTYRSNAFGQAVWIKMVPSDTLTEPTIIGEDERSSETCRIRTITGPDKTSVSLCQVRDVKVYWKFATTHSLSSDEVYNTVLRGLDPSNITLIFSLWRGTWEAEKHAVSPIQQQNTTFYQEQKKFQDSQNLRDSAISYQKMFLAASGVGAQDRYVAVMIRAEHSVLEFLGKRSKNTSQDLKKCMDQLVRETDTAMKEVGGGGLLVTSDVGYYGSGSWSSTISSPDKGDVEEVERTVKRTVERLYAGRQGWTFDQWERSFVEASGGVEERGYIAALQRVLATDRKAACLVLVGGGLFQELSLKQYLHHTRNHAQSRCIRMVCMQRNYQASFTSMLKKAS